MKKKVLNNRNNLDLELFKKTMFIIQLKITFLCNLKQMHFRHKI